MLQIFHGKATQLQDQNIIHLESAKHISTSHRIWHNRTNSKIKKKNNPGASYRKACTNKTNNEHTHTSMDKHADKKSNETKTKSSLRLKRRRSKPL